MSPPKVFIGSPAETLSLAVILQSHLERCSSAHAYHERVFEINRGPLESVLKAVDEYDFACLLAPPLDALSSREQEQVVTRTNIILEYGLFLGRLGPERVFLLYPRDTPPEFPSDLEGVTHIDYKTVDDDNPAVAVLAPAAQQIEEKIRELGPVRPPVSRRHSPILERGSVIAGLSDAVLYYQRKRSGYRDELRSILSHRKVVPSMYYYATEAGAELWLEMSSNARYRFKNNSMRLLRKESKRIAKKVLDSVPDKAVDLISLGSGDGAKDRVLLSGFKQAGSGSIVYYPLDISDKLMVECMKHVHGDTVEFTGVRTKAIIGDFIDLQLLRSVYEDRDSPNLFSILGNTFGNTDEAKIMTALQDSMYPGDFVLIEINCDVGEIEAPQSFLREDVTLRYACVPVEMIGVDVDLQKTQVREEQQLSVFQCAKSTATYYSEIDIEGKLIENVPLAYDHRYPLDSFTDELQDYLEAEVLLSERYGNAALVLARKKSNGNGK